MHNKLIKTGAILACLTVLFVFSSCNRNDKVDEPASTSSSTNIVIIEKEYTDISKSIETTQNEDIGGGDLGLLKYRMNYYDIPAPFAEIVESDIFEKWYNEVLSENPNETNVMVMKRFINHFNISREDFEKANLKWAKIIAEEMDGTPVMDPKDFANQELEEIYNADILYTLDDEIINNYYLSHEYPYVYSYDYKKAIENGEYVSETKDWIDIDQMEADIIAKYGEADTPAAITEEFTEEKNIQSESIE